MNIQTLYHGSDNIIKKPEYNKGKSDNDYGSGFYTTKNIESAKEWAIVNGQDGIAICNQYKIDFHGLNILDLDNFGTIAWIAEVIFNRGTDNALNTEIGQILVNTYKIDTSKADIIIGYRADDSYIKVVDAFLEGKLTIDEVEKMFRKGHLGKQVFIKSPKAFDRLVFVTSYKVEFDQKYGNYDKLARQEVSSFLNARDRAILIEGMDVSSKGLTVRDAIHNYLEYSNGYYTLSNKHK